MKNTKRGLSIFLVLALFITSVGIGFGTGSLKSAVPEAETVSKTDASTIHFYVPETIYLTPSSGNASTFQYYVDSSNSTTPTLDTTKAKTTGNVYFYCANATAVSIACSGATVTGATLTGGTTTISTAITGGTLSTAIAQKATSTLTWTATYTVGGQTMTAKAYTVCYAPPIEPIGVAQRLYNNDGASDPLKADLQGWFYVSGVHGYGSGGVRQFNLTSGKVVAPLLGTVTAPSGNNAYSDWITGSSGGVYYGDWSGGDNTYALNKISPTGILTVDTSRYNNVQLIPNFTCGMAITNTNNMDDLWYYISDYDDVTNYTTDYQGSDSAGVFNNNTGSIFFGDTGTKRTVANSIIYGGTTGGNVYSNAISGNGTYNMKFKGAASANNDGETNTFACVVPVTVTMVNKGTLRDHVRYYTNLGLQAADYTGDAADFTAFQNELSAAAVRLGTVTGTDSSDTLATKYAALTKNTYTATINHQFNNGKTTITETQTYNSGDTVNFAPNSYTGYTLASATGETTATTAQTLVNRRTAITQNYNYTANTYTVAYNGNGNTSGSTASSTHTYDVDKNLTSNGFAKTGYQFAGWATSAGGAVAYSDGVSVKNLSATQGATVTLYAKWTPNTYAVTYSGNGNTSGSIPGNSSHTYDDASNTLQSNSGNLAKTGFTFGGWSLNADGSGTTYTAPQTGVFNFSATQGATVTLYAKWTANPYNVIFNANGGTGSMSNQSIAFGQSANLTSNAFTRTGYGFDGWATTAGGSVAYTNGANYTMSTEGATLYAKWTVKSYNVTFDANGGTGSMTNQSITFGQSANLTSNAFTRTGYDFAGWATSAGGSVAYTNGANYTMNTEGTTLYAQWSTDKVGTFVTVTMVGTDFEVNIQDWVAGSQFQIWTYQHIASDDLLDFTSNVKADQWILSKSYAGAGVLQQDGSITFTIAGFDSPDENYTIAVRVKDENGIFVQEIRDAYTPTQLGIVVIGNVLVDGAVTTGYELNEIEPGKKTLIKVIGNDVAGIVYSAKAIYGPELILIADPINTNEFLWDISALLPGIYTIEITATNGNTTATQEIIFELFAMSPSNPYASINDMELALVPGGVEITPDFANGTFSYKVREPGRSPSSSGGMSAPGTVTDSTTAPGVYHVYGYAMRAGLIGTEGGGYDDGLIKTLVIPRVGGGSASMTFTANQDLSDVANHTAIVFTATATGLTNPQYSFWRYDATGYVLVKDWSSDNTFNWTPARLGEYQLEARAKGEGAGSYELKKNLEVNITDPLLAKADVTTITLNTGELAAATAKKPIMLKAAATGVDKDELLYKFFVYDDDMLNQQLRDYSVDQHCVWTPREAGNYTIIVLVKNSDSFGKYDAIEHFNVTVS